MTDTTKKIALRALNYGVTTPEMNFGVNTKMGLDQGQFLPDGDYAAGQKGSTIRLVSLFRKPPTEKPLRVTLDQYGENLTDRAALARRARAAIPPTPAEAR